VRANNNGKVLVTGGSGFIGRYLVDALLSEKWSVLVLTNKTPFFTKSKSGALQVVQADINDYERMPSLVSQVDFVCHLAAFIPPDHEDSSMAGICVQNNALATLNLAQLAIKYNCSRFILSSAGNCYVYGKDLVSEDAPLYPAARATYYLASKMLGEIYVDHLRQAKGLSSLIFRISSPYGWGMPERSLISRYMKLASQGLPLEVWDGGITTYDYVYVTDIVKLILGALKSGEPGIYNVGSGCACSVLELAKTVKKIFFDKEIPIVVKPPMDSIPASFSALSIEKARKTWNYRPISLEDGLNQYRQYMYGDRQK
jgi:UDP-glucose 4-epimerase